MNSETRGNSQLSQPAVFLDRDGVINRKLPGDYVKRWEEFEFLPDAQEAILLLNKAGMPVFVVSNQRGIALGRMTGAAVDEINEKMRETLLPAKLDGIYVCPHDHADNCGCRKPKPGMLVRAASEHGLDLSTCYLVGDSENDVLAGKAAGCKTILVGAKNGREGHAVPDLFCGNLLEAAKAIIAGLKKRTSRSNSGVDA